MKVFQLPHFDLHLDLDLDLDRRHTEIASNMSIEWKQQPHSSKPQSNPSDITNSDLLNCTHPHSLEIHYYRFLSNQLIIIDKSNKHNYIYIREQQMHWHP